MSNLDLLQKLAEEAFSKGQRDFANNVDYDECPYLGIEKGFQRMKWREGWRDAWNKARKEDE